MTNPYRYPDAELSHEDDRALFRNKPIVQLLRWINLAPAILLAFFSSVFVSIVMLGNYFDAYSLSFIGFVCAFMVVLTSFVVAPIRKMTTATLAYLIGALVAWLMIGDLNADELIMPTNYTFAIMATYSGGLLSLLGCWIFNRVYYA